MDSTRVAYSAKDWDGIVGGVKWTATNLTFSFPSAGSNYEYSNEDTAAHLQFTAVQQAIVRVAYNQIAEFTNLAFTEITETNSVHATLRHSNSTSTRADFTAFANYPGETPVSGDAWYGPGNSQNPQVASYDYHTILHEIGHSVGLKHGHEVGLFGALPSQTDGIEFSVMTYRDYVGAPFDLYRIPAGHGPQTYMMYDIAALQYYYGADFASSGNVASGDTVYTFNTTTGEMSINGVAQGNVSTTNTIFRTIWDGHGTDTYDLSNYTTSMSIDLRPGAWSRFATAQLSNIDGGAGTKTPPGNVANALLYQDDARSLIENATGGSGSDTIIGNQGNNVLTGGGANDRLQGHEGADTLNGGIGGGDTADYTEKTASVFVQLLGAANATAFVGGVLEDTLIGIENLDGGSAADFFYGDSNANKIWGNGGDDLIFGGGGVDKLEGGSGNDTVVYDDKFQSVVVTLNSFTFVSATVGGVAEDLIVNIENVVGGSAADTLTGDGLNNVFRGLGGADILNGAGGLDTADYSDKTLFVLATLNGAVSSTVFVGGLAEDSIVNIESLIGGSAGDFLTGDGLNNTFRGGAGADLIDGAGGSDTADYSDKTVSVVAFAGGTNTTITVGGVGEDILTSIENIIGGSAADTLTGNTFANTFTGMGGADAINGGGGIDTASYADKTASVNALLNGSVLSTVIVGGLIEDTLQNIENVTGGSGNDDLTGDASANRLEGGDGDDRLTGAGGIDALVGGAGNDTAVYSEKATGVAVTLNGSAFVGVSVGGVAEDNIFGIENVQGGSAADTLTGDSLANVFTGMGGVDILDGASGSDTAQFFDKSAAVVVTLNGSTAAIVTVGGVNEDSLVNIENLFGGLGNDTLTGDGLDNRLEGYFGDDTLIGADGNDILIGGNQNDVIRGGLGNDQMFGDAGIDTADFSDLTTRITTTLRVGVTVTVYSDEIAQDTMSGFENITGGSANDDLRGDENANVLSGNGGIDTLNGEDGVDTLNGGTENDTLSGGDGNDTLFGDGGDDTISGDAGADEIDGGAGTDRATYWGETLNVSVTLNGAANALVAIGGVFDDVLRNIESLISGSGNDTLTGDANNNTFQGNDGNDTLNGAGGFDFLSGVEGNDVLIAGPGGGSLNGGNGTDTADFSGETLDLGAVLNGATLAQVTLNGVNYSNVRGVENLIGGSGNDTLTGDGLANALSGGDGNDVLTGLGGVDTLNGGAGIDTSNYNAETSAVVVTLNGATPVQVTIGGVVDDTISEIENLIGGEGNDIFNGDGAANRLGGDWGNDTLNGGGGNDVLEGSVGLDALNGGADIDTAIYSEKTSAVSVTLNGAVAALVTVGGVAEDTLANIENLIGGSAGDTFTGDAQDNRFEGNAGTDTLNGGGGNDIFIGGADLDTMDGSDGSDTADYSSETQILVADLDGANFVNVADDFGAPIDQIRNIENLIGGSANDLLFGDDANNRFEGRDGDDGMAGGLGDDALKGGSGNDNLDGEGGNDTADYSDKTVSVSGGTGDISFMFIGAETDTLFNIENLIGGSAADFLVGDARDNRLQGLGGADQLDGGAGNDTADYSEDTFGLFVDLGPGGILSVTIGGSASDTIQNFENIIGGSGGDALFGDGLANVFVGNDGSDSLNGAGGDDLMRGGTGVDNMNGGTGIDTADYSDRTQSVVGTLNGSASVFFSVGGAFEDFIAAFENVTGGSAADSLIGDGLDNRFKGMGGADTLNGGAGNDVADYSDKKVSVVATLVDAAFSFVSVGGVNEDSIIFFEGLTGGSANDVLTGDLLNNLLEGGAGDDVLTGMGGFDTLDGGAGRDRADFSLTTGEIEVVFSGATAASVVIGGFAQDTIASIEELVGGVFNDSVQGDALDNSLLGEGGDDNLFGGGGQDTVDGGAGNDVLSGEDGFDFLNGGAGTDTAQYDDKTVAVTITLDGGTIVQALVDGVADDQLQNIENLIGGSGNDSFLGDGLDNRLEGGIGNDNLVGAAGNDVLLGGAGADFLHGAQGQDTIDGGADFDFAEYRYDTMNIVVTLRGALDANVLIGGVIEDTIRNVEGFLSGTGSDTITGDALHNSLYGGDGNDAINGGGGNDDMSGGQGNDTYFVAQAVDNVFEQLAEGSADLVFSSLTSYALTANVENLTLLTGALNGTGNVLDNRLTGNTAANSLSGGQGNDWLDAGANADTMDGGIGNDTFVVDSLLDVVIDGAGVDTIMSGVQLAAPLQAGIENLTLTGATALNGFGNALNNRIVGNTAVNTLDGDAGNDVLEGGIGNDILTGGIGNDTLNGGSGNDTMTGGVGNDVYVIDTLNDVINENAGEGTADRIESTTTVNALHAEVEDLTLLGALNLNGTGNAMANRITGNSGNNVLDGLGGADILQGGAGNDIYRVDVAGETIFEAADAGTDRVESSITYVLSNNVENLTLLGSGNIGGVGTAAANVLIGNSGDNGLNGGSGADSMSGGAGNDTYFVDNIGDTIFENNVPGVDLVQSSVDFTLALFVENLVLTGAAVTGTGNGQNNTITGNSGNNTLNGLAGADTLIGGAGNDTYVVDNAGDVVTDSVGSADHIQSSVTRTLEAGIERLTLTGGLAINGTGNTQVNIIVGNGAANILDGKGGADTMTGGAGLDVFVFSALESAIDTITDFVVADDQIMISAAAFGGTLVAGGPVNFAFGNGIPAPGNANSWFLFDDLTGNLYFDRNGAIAGDMFHIAVVNGGQNALSSGDFTVAA